MKLADIIIPDYLAESVPNEAKMNRVKRYFLKYGELDKPIIINHKKELVDGYIRYLVLKEFDVEDIKQYRYKRENSKVITYMASTQISKVIKSTFGECQHLKNGTCLWRTYR